MLAATTTSPPRAHARRPATLELDAAVVAGERSYRLLRERRDDYDRRLQAVGQRLRDPGRPSPRRAPQGPHC